MQKHVSSRHSDDKLTYEAMEVETYGAMHKETLAKL